MFSNKSLAIIDVSIDTVKHAIRAFKYWVGVRQILASSNNNSKVIFHLVIIRRTLLVLYPELKLAM